MEETLPSQKIAEIDFVNNPEKKSSKIPNRILKLKSCFLKDNHQEQ